MYSTKIVRFSVLICLSPNVQLMFHWCVQISVLLTPSFRTKHGTVSAGWVLGSPLIAIFVSDEIPQPVAQHNDDIYK